MRKVINYNEKEIEIIATKITSPFIYYEYKIFELLKKKHWWNCRRTEIVSGTTFWWSNEKDFETEIMHEIDIYYKTKTLNNVEKFFEKPLDK